LDCASNVCALSIKLAADGPAVEPFAMALADADPDPEPGSELVVEGFADFSAFGVFLAAFLVRVMVVLIDASSGEEKEVQDE
jgi:hypothetical protein